MAHPHPEDNLDRLERALAPVRQAPYLRTQLGALYAGDCMGVLPDLREASVDLVFADPPFNIGKDYGVRGDDARPEAEYLDWCRAWLDECVRVLAPGGALFVYNIPRWNLALGAHLMARGLSFRHDIAVEMKNAFKIKGRLYPSRYSLLYFTKGAPRTFRSIRTPVPRCRKCSATIHDYGGHLKKLHPDGLNLTDIWTDIPVVRHRKYKPKGRSANTLSTKLLERVLAIASESGDLVLDPFGGAGTTFAVAERHGRRWIGTELNDAAVIAERLRDPCPAFHRNDDVVDMSG